MLRSVFFAAVVFAFMAMPVVAQDAAPVSTGDQPIEITAKQTLEWHRNQQQYVARGDAIAKQGDAQIESDTLTANYRDTDEQKNQIYIMRAEGHVIVSGQGAVAHGDHGVYEVDKALATLTGDHLVMTSPDQTVTAKDKFEYWTNEGRLNAIGNAHGIRGEDTIDSDMLTAYFLQDPQTHKRALDRLEAHGHVVIVTPTEILHGDWGVYHKATNIAEVFGHVTIKRGPNLLQGDSADIDMNTNISRMHAGKGENTRVRGLFFPGSKDGTPAPADKKPGKAAAKPTAVPVAETPVSPAVSAAPNPVPAASAAAPAPVAAMPAVVPAAPAPAGPPVPPAASTPAAPAPATPAAAAPAEPVRAKEALPQDR